MLLVLVAASATSFELQTGPAYAATGIVRPDGDVTRGFANCTPSCATSHYTAIDEETNNTSDYVSTGSSGGTGDEEEYTFTSVAGTDGTVSKVDVNFYAHSDPIGAVAPDDLQVRITIDGSYQSAQTFQMPPSPSNTLYTASFSGNWTGDDDLQVEFVRVVQGFGSQSSRDDDVRITQVYAEVTYEPHINFDLDQSAYRWFENANSTNVGAALAANNTPATFNSPGEAFRLRQSLHVSGDNMGQNGQDLKLQYVDKGTGTCQLPTGGTPSIYTTVGLGVDEWKAPIWEKRSTFQVVEFDGKIWAIGGYSGFSAVGAYADVWYSTDGLNWTLATDQPGWSSRQQHAVVAHNDKLYVIGGWGTSALSDVWSSSDGVNWVEETSSANFGGLYRTTAVSFGGKMWVLGGVDGSSYLNEVWSSSDGVSWTQEATPSWAARAYHEATVFDGKMWVMGGTNGSSDSNDVWWSSNGTSWTRATASANWSARETFSVAVANGKMWVMGGWDGARRNDVWSSSDGVSWTQETASADWVGRSYHEAVGFDNKVWIFGGHDGSNARNDVWSSANGSSWTNTVGQIERRHGHMSVIHDGKMWVIGGLNGATGTFFNDVYYSSDGTNWTRATNSASWPGRMAGALLSFDNKLWIMGGWSGTTRLNDVWSSSDGVTWTQETSSAGWSDRNYPAAMVFGGKMWLMGGLGNSNALYNDVWSSTDGSNWTQETSSAGWSGRYGPYGTVFNGKMYILGGGSASGAYSDVWSSTDGSNWTQETSSAGWSNRLQFEGTVFDGKLWIYGGRDAPDSVATRNDLWSSSNGVDWVKENSSVYASPRYLTTMMAYNERIWMIGGEDAVSNSLADIRYIEDSLITWNDNSTPSHGAALTNNAGDPSHSGHTVVNQSYLEGNPFTNNQSAINDGQDGLWDFSLVDNGAQVGSTYCFRVVGSNGTPLSTYSTYPEITINDSSPPNTPGSLSQVKVTGGATVGVGDWTNEGQMKFVAAASDPDASDTLQLCVERQPLGTNFTGAETSCGTGASYSGTPVNTEVTIGSLTQGQYHWQARIRDANGDYSAWMSFGDNLESARDFGVDTTAPTNIAVYDGTNTGVDAMLNNGSLSSLSANWSSNANISSLQGYEYSIGTTPGGTNVRGWTSTGTSTSITASSLSLSTSQTYYFNVRVTDNAGNVATGSSNGQLVAPTLTFSSSTNTVNFGALNASNNYTASQTTTLSISTNAKNGYAIYGKATDFLRSHSLEIVPMFNGGTYAAPAAWGSNTGLGYHSSDTSVGGSNRFNSATCLGGGAAPCFAPHSTTGIGDIVADKGAIPSGGPALDDNITITNRVRVNSTSQEAGRYQTTILYSAYATY